MPRVIFVNRFFHPDVSATSQMLSDLAFALAARGHEVVVVASRMRYDDPACRLPARERHRDVRIERVATTRFGRMRLAGRLADYASFYASVAWRVGRLARRGDVLVIKTDPPLMSVVLGPVCRLRGLRRVAWLQDLFPEVAEAAGVKLGPDALDRRLHALLRGLRNRALERSDAVVVIGERMRRRVARDVRTTPIHRFPNWTDADVVRPIPPPGNPLRAAWALDGAFVVAYSGNLGFAHPIDAVVEAAERLRHRADIVFLFVGGGVRRAALERAVAERDLSATVRFRPYQDRESLSSSLGVGDVHLVTLDPAMEGLIVPSKFYGICAAGRPTVFVGAADGELALELAERGCGVQVDVDDGAALARAIEAYADDPARCDAEGTRARASLVAGDTVEHALARWDGLLAELGAAPR